MQMAMWRKNRATFATIFSAVYSSYRIAEFRYRELLVTAANLHVELNGAQDKIPIQAHN